MMFHGAQSAGTKTLVGGRKAPFQIFFPQRHMLQAHRVLTAYSLERNDTLKEQEISSYGKDSFLSLLSLRRLVSMPKVEDVAAAITSAEGRLSLSNLRKNISFLK
jgi:hypothetical protein